MPENLLLESMQSELDLVEAEKVQVAEAYGNVPGGGAGVDATLHSDEVMRVLRTVLKGLTRTEVETQICGPKFTDEYGGKDYIHCIGLADNR